MGGGVTINGFYIKNSNQKYFANEIFSVNQLNKNVYFSVLLKYFKSKFPKSLPDKTELFNGNTHVSIRLSYKE